MRGVRPQHQTVELKLGVPGVAPAEHANTVLFLNELLARSVILPEEWDELDPTARVNLYALDNQQAVLEQLVTLHLLTPFQADMIRDGAVTNLTLGQYRVLALLGRGGMGSVYRAEHIHLRRNVAIKVFVNATDTSVQLLRRFQAEARSAARLHHPNLVACLDAGRSLPAQTNGPIRDYYVMELVNGPDLGNLVHQRGPLPVSRACDVFRQVAEGLAEAHRHGLIHRDIKPQNIIVTPDWQAKVLDFGLALHPYRRMTEPGTVLGTIGYMAPEQARDPHTVDARADLFSMGASMYWALTGKDPFPDTGNLLHDFQARLTDSPPLIQQIRPELPEELYTLVNRMLSTDPDARPPSARVLAISLAGLSRWVPLSTTSEANTLVAEKPTVAVVDDDVAVRKLLRLYLGDEFTVVETGDGDGLRDLLQRQKVDLIILDVNLPGVSGDTLLESVQGTNDNTRRPLILLISGVIPTESLGGLLTSGADDFLAKPFSRSEFRSRVRALLGRKANQQPQTSTTASDGSSLYRTPMPAQSLPPLQSDAIPAGLRVLSSMLAQMLRETLTFSPSYGERLGRYVRAVAAVVPDTGEYSRLKEERFLELLSVVAPFHDVGMMAMPHTIIHKPGPLDAHERTVIETHPVLGADWIIATSNKCPGELPVLSLAADVVRSHHERWDGKGYPDGFAAERIPLAARMVSFVSVYDALRSRRAYRPALSHARVIRMIATESVGQFDPTLVAGLEKVAPQFEKIFRAVDA